MKIKQHYIISLFLLLILLTACTTKSNNTKNSKNQLNIGVMSSMDYLPLAVAQENGFFKKEGVNITIHKFYSANERDAAFQSENLDGTILDYTGAAIQLAGGVKLKITSQCDGTFVLIAGKDSGVKSVNDLEGKHLAVSRNTVIDFCTDLVLQKAGIGLDDIEKVEINKIPLRLEMLRNGKIDATMLPDPFATLALQDGNRSIIDIRELDLHVTGIAFHEKVIEQNPKTINSFYRAYNQAVVLLNSEPANSFHSILISDIGIPAELVSQIKLPNYSMAQLPKERDLEKVEHWLKTKNLVSSDFDISTLISSDLIP
ncbi:MAG: MetQ/NlpA family ABC transporter substrate-binding protein [Dysgonamonadaceae bacterium]